MWQGLQREARLHLTPHQRKFEKVSLCTLLQILKFHQSKIKKHEANHVQGEFNGEFIGALSNLESGRGLKVTSDPLTLWSCQRYGPRIS